MIQEVCLHNFPSGVKRLNAAVEFIIIGQSRHEKDLGCCLLLHRDIQQQTASQVFLMDRGKPR